MRGDVRAGRWQAAGDRGARSVQGRELDCRLGGGPGEERTPNMPYMLVTLEVSKLSGWLNAAAPCRESNGGHAARGEVRAGDRGARSVQGRARLQNRGRARGGAHVEHGVHVQHSRGGGGHVLRLAPPPWRQAAEDLSSEGRGGCLDSVR